jgi:hypothetical protein
VLSDLNCFGLVVAELARCGVLAQKPAEISFANASFEIHTSQPLLSFLASVNDLTQKKSRQQRKLRLHLPSIVLDTIPQNSRQRDREEPTAIYFASRIASTENVTEVLNVICQADDGCILVGLHWC